MVTNWELNRNQPTVKFAKTIIDFIGYIPFNVEDCSLGKQLYYARLITGKTQREVAAEIGCDSSNLRYIELGLGIPQSKTREKIDRFIMMAQTNYLVAVLFKQHTMDSFLKKA
ncbi:MAG: multiprotein-bridging factor 1 family protein [Saprospiraceae bacterium]